MTVRVVAVFEKPAFNDETEELEGEGCDVDGFPAGLVCKAEMGAIV